MTTDDKPLTHVRWVDHFQTYGWHEQADPDTDPIVVDTIGWLVADGEEMLVLQNGIARNSTKCLDSMSILHSAIIGRWVIDCEP